MNMNWKQKTFLVAGLLGLLTGLGTAYFIVQRAELQESPPSLNAGDGLKLGALLIGALRQISQIAEGNS